MNCQWCNTSNDPEYCNSCVMEVRKDKAKSIENKFNKLWKYKITLLQWPAWKSPWRLRIQSPWEDWLFTDDVWNDFDYLIEQPTIEKCLDRAIRYIETWEV